MSRRQTPRAPILTQVEAQGEAGVLLGRARNVSSGGLLIESRETLAEGATVVIRFFLPPDRTPIEAAGRIARVEAGKSMAISFLGLADHHREKVVAYVRSHPPEPEQLVLDLPESTPRRRRSGRIARRLPVMLAWQNGGGRSHHQAAETIMLSRNGAAFLSLAELPVGQLIHLTVSTSGKECPARVVSCQPSSTLGKVELAVEFLTATEMWEEAFLPEGVEAVPGQKPSRRRSARLPKRKAVLLCWKDEMGRMREESAETRSVSRHGAALCAEVGLPVGQRLSLRDPASGRQAEARVVWDEKGEIPGRTNLGVEILAVADFWGIEFPLDPGAKNR